MTTSRAVGKRGRRGSDAKLALKLALSIAVIDLTAAINDTRMEPTSRATSFQDAAPLP